MTTLIWYIYFRITLINFRFQWPSSWCGSNSGTIVIKKKKTCRTHLCVTSLHNKNFDRNVTEWPYWFAIPIFINYINWISISNTILMVWVNLKNHLYINPIKKNSKSFPEDKICYCLNPIHKFFFYLGLQKLDWLFFVDTSVTNTTREWNRTSNLECKDSYLIYKFLIKYPFFFFVWNFTYLNCDLWYRETYTLVSLVR